MQPKCALFLAREWDAAWREIVRPWLASPVALRRDFVVVPTRGQAHALKLRCVREDLPLLGIEFLTPGLARQKWAALAPPARPALGRELLLLNLRALVDERLARLAPEVPAWGWWKSLQSDAEGALDAFDELLHAGLSSAEFALPALQEVFGELERRVAATGYDFAARQNIVAAARPAPAEARLGGRLLVYGFTAEHAREFFSLVALARRAADVTVVVPEPAFDRKDHDERWVEAWEQMLGTEALPVESSGTAWPGTAVAQLWTTGGAAMVAPVPATVLVGHTRADEMQLVAEEVARRLAAGAANIAVIFPCAGAAHLRLARLLAAQELPFNDLLETAGPVAVDLQLQHALLAFHERGARLEELLALWPLLHATGHTTLAPGAARDVCERVFDARQTHSLATVLPDLAARERPEWREVARVAGLLLPAWPERLTLKEALDRFAALGERLHLPGADGWQALAVYAEQDRRELPAKVVIAALASFLPEKSPAVGTPGRGLFAPVTLTTWRRASALAWSDVIFTESNAGVWPVRAEPGGWLTDEQREALNPRARPGTVLFTGDSRAWLEKQGVTAVAANTTGTVAFSAALFDEEEPELKLAPNAWLERILLAGDDAPLAERGLEERFSDLARRVAPPATGADAATTAWFDIWRRRRDPAAAFDDYFLGGDPGVTRPTELSARLIERSVADPAELWFEGVLRLQRVPWSPLVRARNKSLGSLAHRVLAAALRGAPVEGIFKELPGEADARAALALELVRQRALWPRDRYWDSFHAELAEMTSGLLAQVYRLPAGEFVAVEARLPEGTSIPLGGDERVGVIGRMDLVRIDRPQWGGAQVDVVDFKTGADAPMSARTMARGASLQLGVYLAAVETLGVAGGRVWMLKTDATKPACIGVSDLPEALAALAQLGRHFATGRYGALTVDRTDFSRGFAWPLACVPIRHAVLEKKFAATFGTAAAEVGDA
ncbi:MAG TPA: PD-(D/E)XK nuclease family protein [Lacunisphaera sp.]|nr:PD-(D/E)XK nuclease family protein [Lacunisphaera sp.]